jgi:hypothetical protein
MNDTPAQTPEEMIMAITFRCPCGKILQANEASAGKVLRCPVCGQCLRAPSAAKVIAAGVQPAATAKGPPALPTKAGLASATDARPRKSARPGKSKPAPLTPLEESWKNSRLLGANEFQIVWDTLIRPKGRGCTFCRPGTKDALGTSAYQDSILRFVLRQVNLAQFLPPWIAFQDEHKGTLFFLKVVKLVNNRYDIYSPDRKELLGSLKTVFSLKLWLRLLDREGNDVGEMLSADLPAAGGKGSYFGFHVKSTDGRTLGEITSTGFHLSRFNLANKGYKINTGYVGRVRQEFADDPRTKALVLAATWVANAENMGARHLDPIKA